MKYTAQIIAALLLTLLAGPRAVGQVPVPAPLPSEVEGTISGISRVRNVVTMTVMNMTIRVPAGTPINSPTAKLTPQQLANARPLPGRTEPGFIGGTAKIAGTVDAQGIITAQDVFVEPAENVVVGAATATAGGALEVNGVPVSLLRDPRLRAGVPVNAFGFGIDLASVAPGTSVSVEGFFSLGIFNAFHVEVDGEAQLLRARPQVAIVRAQARENTPNDLVGDELEVRGSVTTAHMRVGETTQLIRIFRVDRGVRRLLGTATAVVDPAVPGFAEFRFRTVTPPNAGRRLGAAPTLVRAVNVSRGARNASADLRPTVVP